MTDTKFAKKLRHASNRFEKSEAYLAKATRLDRTFIRRLMDGQKRPSIRTIMLLTIALLSCPELLAKREVEAAQLFSDLLGALVDDEIAGSK